MEVDEKVVSELVQEILGKESNFLNVKYLSEGEKISEIKNILEEVVNK